MKCTPTAIDDVKILEPQLFCDARGSFCETFSERTLELLGIPTRFVQDNESVSVRGVVRGLHYQKPPFAQAKIVRVLEGDVLDVALDIRRSSPTFGRWVAVRLAEANRRMLYIPEGFAHGFCALTARVKVAYKCSAFYAPEAEGAIDALDASLGIDWEGALRGARAPATSDALQLLRSEKDARAPSFASYCAQPVF